MPRLLPWEKKAEEKKTAVPASKRSNNTVADVSDRVSNNPATPSRRKRTILNAGRTPSTSPPAPAPLSVEYMQPGFDADDRWMMVEDEFHSTAQMFTQHIHHAEYVRLKQLARGRGRQTLQDLVRPTDGKTEASSAGKLVREKAQMDKTIRKAMDDGEQGEEEGGEDEEEAWRADLTLAGLMVGQARKVRELMGPGQARVNTRAAAGFQQSPHSRLEKRPSRAMYQDGVSSVLDDDLDTKPKRLSLVRAEPQPSDRTDSRLSFKPDQGSNRKAKPDRVVDDGGPTVEQSAPSPTRTSPSDGFLGREHDRSKTRDVSKSQENSIEGSGDKPTCHQDMESMRSAQRTAASDYLAKRRLAKRKRELRETEAAEQEAGQEPPKPKRMEIDLPTWL